MRLFCVSWLLFVCMMTLPTDAEEAAVDPGPNRSDEPVRSSFSLERAISFLDHASIEWQKQRKCFTCHTNFAFLYARPMIDADAEAHRTVRHFAEQLVQQRWSEKGPRWDAEIVAAAAALAFNDANTTGELHPATRTALERMWTVQRHDGGWNWLKCNWPPMESDDHYGATLGAIAAGVAPGDYKTSPSARKGLERLRDYFNNNPPPTLHHRAMLLWAARYHHDLITEEDRRETIDHLLDLQRPDGGWATASLGDWKRGDGKQQDKTTSDGYGTGFVLFILRQADVPPSRDEIQRGVDWLKTNQRESGRWFSRSLYKDNKHYLSHAGTAFALMALRACDAL